VGHVRLIADRHAASQVENCCDRQQPERRARRSGCLRARSVPFPSAPIPKGLPSRHRERRRAPGFERHLRPGSSCLAGLQQPDAVAVLTAMTRKPS
jgi:hypothetical protein